MQRWPILIVLLTLTLPVCRAADSVDPDTPLGDIARAFRQDKDKDKDKDKKTPEHTIIDNENLDQLMNQLQSQKFNRASLVFSFDGLGKSFNISAPDVTCSLSFSAKATSLISDPFMPREVPSSELVKLDGPAVIRGNTLEVSVFNGSAWNIKELTVGITTLRTSVRRQYGPSLLQPAAETVVESSQKRSDQTVLYHLKGTAAPESTTVFTADLTEELGSDQEWHWAIVSAKGVLAEPPASIATPSILPPATPTTEPAPATSSSNPHP